MIGPLLSASATALARMIRAPRGRPRARSSRRTSRRIERVNPALNAVVRERFDEARAEARAADARAATGDAERCRRSTACRARSRSASRSTGMPQHRRASSRAQASSRDARRDRGRAAARGRRHPARRHQRLRALHVDGERTTASTAAPTTRTTRAASSAAARAARARSSAPAASPFGLGSDIGGSIRMPAFFNGVFGHKPTGGLVPNTGQYPLAANDALRYLDDRPDRAPRRGSLCRCCASSPAPTAATPAAADRARRSRAVDLVGLTVLDVEDNGALRVAPSCARRSATRPRALARARRDGRARRSRARAIVRHLVGDARRGRAGTRSARCSATAAPIASARELVRWASRRSPHTLPSLALALLETLPEAAAVAIGARCVELGPRAARELAALLGAARRDALSVVPRPRRATTAPLLPPFHWAYTAIFNVLELPVDAGAARPQRERAAARRAGRRRARQRSRDDRRRARARARASAAGCRRRRSRDRRPRQRRDAVYSAARGRPDHPGARPPRAARCGSTPTATTAPGGFLRDVIKVHPLVIEHLRGARQSQGRRSR